MVDGELERVLSPGRRSCLLNAHSEHHVDHHTGRRSLQGWSMEPGSGKSHGLVTDDVPCAGLPSARSCRAADWMNYTHFSGFGDARTLGRRDTAQQVAVGSNDPGAGLGGDDASRFGRSQQLRALNMLSDPVCCDITLVRHRSHFAASRSQSSSAQVHDVLGASVYHKQVSPKQGPPHKSAVDSIVQAVRSESAAPSVDSTPHKSAVASIVQAVRSESAAPSVDSNMQVVRSETKSPQTETEPKLLASARCNPESSASTAFPQQVTSKQEALACSKPIPFPADASGGSAGDRHAGDCPWHHEVFVHRQEAKEFAELIGRLPSSRYVQHCRPADRGRDQALWDSTQSPLPLHQHQPPYSRQQDNKQAEKQNVSRNQLTMARSSSCPSARWRSNNLTAQPASSHNPDKKSLLDNLLQRVDRLASLSTEINNLPVKATESMAYFPRRPIFGGKDSPCREDGASGVSPLSNTSTIDSTPRVVDGAPTLRQSTSETRSLPCSATSPGVQKPRALSAARVAASSQDQWKATRRAGWLN
eukprot:TRINITY_DN7697_c0_g1_i3.p1 TRINITY_DN7697_c0_g1~~TRINITY_DN7697_c0_g1_i3.p1  ORF type:complete len:532 (-),score=68.38 TRINITY_DN7697_c0_g1_i3:50-1645(-)